MNGGNGVLPEIDELRLMRMSDLMRIAYFFDAVAKEFPSIRKMDGLNAMQDAAQNALLRTEDAGESGRMEAKLDRAIKLMEFVAGKHQLVEQLAGPVPEQGMETVEARSLRMQQKTQRPFVEHDLSSRTPDFDKEPL